jgi:hypothetical protein
MPMVINTTVSSPWAYRKGRVSWSLGAPVARMLAIVMKDSLIAVYVMDLDATCSPMARPGKSIASMIGASEPDSLA